MTPGPAVWTARELPRKSPVPMAPPMAIIEICADVSWRESCSPFSMCWVGWANGLVYCGLSARGRSRKIPLTDVRGSVDSGPGTSALGFLAEVYFGIDSGHRDAAV